MNIYGKVNKLLKEFSDFSTLSDEELINRFKEAKSNIDYNTLTGQWDDSYDVLFNLNSEIERRIDELSSQNSPENVSRLNLLQSIDSLFENQNRKLIEHSYDDSIFTSIEEALLNAGLDVDRYSDIGMVTNNLGWVVSNSEGEVNLTCAGTHLDENDMKNIKESETTERIANLKNDLADIVYTEMDTKVIKDVLNDVKYYCDELLNELLNESELPEDPFSYLTEEDNTNNSEIVYTKQVVDTNTNDSILFTDDYTDEEAINSFVKDYYPESKPEHCFVEHLDEPIINKLSDKSDSTNEK